MKSALACALQSSAREVRLPAVCKRDAGIRVSKGGVRRLPITKIFAPRGASRRRPNDCIDRDLCRRLFPAASSTGSASSPRPASTAGWCRRPRCAIHLVHRHGLRLLSVFWLPLSQAIPASPGSGGLRGRRSASMTLRSSPRACDWQRRRSRLDVHAVLRAASARSAAIWGGWLERVGPRQRGLRLGPAAGAAACVDLRRFGVDAPPAVADVARVRA
jgi:hypothetical protein